MKRLLGRVLRSELDLEQLEVQLGAGRMQLRDLALNTDYINDQVRMNAYLSVSVLNLWGPQQALRCPLRIVVVRPLGLLDSSPKLYD